MVEIRPLSRDDVERVQELASDPAVAEMTRLPSPYPPDGAAKFFEQSQTERREGRGFVFALVAGGELVGLCSLRDVGSEPESAELGYWIGRPYWGRGLASAGAASVVAWGFGELELRRLFARTMERNAASARVLEKLGFEAVSRQPNPHARYRPDDVIVRYELDRERWRTLRVDVSRVDAARRGQ